MKIAILQCDEVLERLQPEFKSYSEMIRGMFHELDSSIIIDIFNCQQCQYPDDIHAYDAFVTTGSRAGAYEDTPWIKQLIQFIQLLEQQQKKLIGICFGHQVIATALQQSVIRSEKGWGVGIAVNRVVAAPDWMDKKVTELNIIVSHRDQVAGLPDQAVVIAESDFCPYFIVQWNSYFLSIQGHPEWNKNFSKALMNERRDIIPTERIQQGMDSLNLDTHNQLFTAWVLSFVKK